MEHSSQESDMMKKPVNEVNSSACSSSTSLDEWTIIDDKEAKDSPLENEIKIRNNDDDDDEESITAEEARETIEELEKDKIEEIGYDSFVQRDEESDGISVISESEKGDHDLSNDQSNNFDNTTNIPQIGAYMHIIIACTLAAAVGFGIGFFLNAKNNQLASSSSIVELAEESFQPLDKPKTSADRVFGDVPSGIETDTIIGNYQKHKINEEFISKKIIKQKNKEPTINTQNINNFKNIETFKDDLNKIKYSLDTLCTILDDNHDENNEIIRCKKVNSINKLIELKNTVEYINSEFGNDFDLPTEKFMTNIDTKIVSISKSLLNDMNKIIDNSLLKIERSKDKLLEKFNKKICIMRNTMTSDSKVIKLLQSRNISLENCERITPPPKEYKNSKKVVDDNKEKKNVKNNEEKKYSKKEDKEDKIKKFKGEMKRNFVEEYNVNSNDNMRKQVWPSFKNKQNKKNNDSKKKYEPISPNGEVCYQKKSCSKKFDGHVNKNVHEDIRNVDDNIDNWQFKRARDRHSQREEKNYDSNFGWYYDRAKSRESARQRI